MYFNNKIKKTFWNILYILFVYVHVVWLLINNRKLKISVGLEGNILDQKGSADRITGLKRDSSPKKLISVIIYSPSCCFFILLNIK